MKSANISLGNNVEIDPSTLFNNVDAYSPLMLLKGLLMQKWYRIDFHKQFNYTTFNRTVVSPYNSEPQKG